MGSALSAGVAGGWCGFRRNCSRGGHEVCRGDEVCRVLLNSAGDRLLKSCVRFQVDEKEADVCFKLLPKVRDGALVMGRSVSRSVRRLLCCSTRQYSRSNCCRMRFVLIGGATGVPNGRF
jgi:hypothetical protein